VINALADHIAIIGYKSGARKSGVHKNVCKCVVNVACKFVFSLTRKHVFLTSNHSLCCTATATAAAAASQCRAPSICRFTTVALLATSLLSSCHSSQSTQLKHRQEWKFTGTAMGTTWHATVVSPIETPSSDAALSSEQLQRQIQDNIEQLLLGINAHMSTYDSSSALSQFNATTSTDWIEQPTPVIELLRSAAAISEQTQGAYDVTLGGLVDLWGFGSSGDTGRDSRQKVLPEHVNARIDKAGYHLLQYSDDNQRLRKRVATLQVDLSSIAKGYAVDRVGDMFEGMGIDRYLFELGGEIRTRGQAGDNSAWVIALESPELAGLGRAPAVQSGTSAIKAISVENAHIATSGDYRNYREIDGKRISHLIDGRTGYPVTNRLASVTVIHHTTQLADAWATAFMVIGADMALAMAQSSGLAISLTEREKSGYTTRNSEAFDAYLLDSEPPRLSVGARLKHLFGS